MLACAEAGNTRERSRHNFHLARNRDIANTLIFMQRRWVIMEYNPIASVFFSVKRAGLHAFTNTPVGGPGILGNGLD